MKKLMLAAVGTMGILASCGGGGAGDGSARGNITQIRTEYRLGSASGKFIACDTIASNPGRSRQTQVAVDFNLTGTIQDLTISLKGGNGTTYDGNFTKKILAKELPGTAGKYRITFNADSSTQGGLLPQSIIVNPVPVKVKVVSTAANSRAGFFYPAFQVNTGSDSFNFSGLLTKTVDVYTNCTVTQNTDEDI